MERVYHAYVDSVFRRVRHGFHLKDGRRVEGIREPQAQRDLVQEVFVRAFAERARLAYDGLRPYGPYLLRIAGNQLVDRWRSHGAELSAADAAGALEAAEPEVAQDAEEDLHWRALREATQSCVLGMDDEMRAFVRFRFEEDLSQREVAARMGVTRRRVRTLEDAALDRLRKHLTGLGFC
ncbi:MAG: sigma-70 family RNA polymerase sigma factor [Deltaproteobacteria bacterium]|nr:sigma-70 family RNA polymerase sigma factor [Deltaproteobacteria bacterium]